MTPLEETLYNFILDNDLEARYQQTAYHRRREAQRLLLEQLQRAYDRTQDCELEAMFLAAFHQAASLLGREPPPTSPAGR